MRTAATRTLFLHIGPAEQGLFYALSVVALAVMLWGIARRVRVWRQGKPSLGTIDWPARLRDLAGQVALQQRVRRRRFAGGMHGSLFYGFAVLFLGTCIVAVEHWGELIFGQHWLYKGGFYLACKICLDIAGVLLIVGVVAALGRRYFARPRSLGNASIDAVFLPLLLLAGLTGFALEGARLALTHPPESVTRFEPIGALFATLMAQMTAAAYVGLWWLHAAIALSVIALLPYGRWLHIFTVPATILRQPDRPMGVLESIATADVEQTGRCGYGVASDMSQWELMSLDACMECGRCTDVCPAHAVGKELDPKRVVLDLRRMAESMKGDATTDVVSDESLWACTNCHACVRECPADIRHVDLIDNIRRFRVTEGRLAGTAAKTLRQIASRENPWGMSAAQRLDWAHGLDVPIAEPGDEREVLLWVGCAGAFDPGAQKITRAVVQLLQRAGVSFAVLGPKERCTGDPARRIGDDFLYSELAAKNIETLSHVHAKTIVAQCPHCFHTIGNEYPQLGGNYEVLHHTQYLARLVEQGRLKLSEDYADSVVYHDPCFLARVNNETAAPRTLLRGSLQLPLIEPTRSGSRTLCCGAGGGRMWMEDAPTQRPAANRAAELMATGATTIATGCPFCKRMLGDGVAQRGGERVPQVMDIAEVMLSASGTDASDAPSRSLEDPENG